MGSISHHITPLVVNSLGGGDTHTHTHTHILKFTDRSNSKKPGSHQPVAGVRQVKKYNTELSESIKQQILTLFHCQNFFIGYSKR